VVLDLDETVLDNSPYAGWQIRHGSAYSSESWQAWVTRGEATAVPGVTEYLSAARQMGLQILYLSNRKRSQWQATRRNMQALGLPLEGLDSLWLRDRISDKQTRRDSIRQRYTVIQWVGDNLMDMEGFKANLTEHERDQFLMQQGHRLGRDWVLLPNPVYGPWEDMWHSQPESEQRTVRLARRLRFFRP